MALGLLCCLLGVVWQCRAACSALMACVSPPTRLEDHDNRSNKTAPRAGATHWIAALLQLLAVRPIFLPLMCAGVVFLSMAAYSDNFTINVSSNDGVQFQFGVIHF